MLFKKCLLFIPAASEDDSIWRSYYYSRDFQKEFLQW